jgi:hypothetical protein
MPFTKWKQKGNARVALAKIINVGLRCILPSAATVCEKWPLMKRPPKINKSCILSK